MDATRPAVDQRAQEPAEPQTLAELHLPPTFVLEHCIRTLSYQGAMSPTEIAKHWRVHPDIAVEITTTLKANALIELESGQSTYERLGRVRLSQTGQARVAGARGRTWYAGALPVTVDEFERRARVQRPSITTRAEMRDALAAFVLEDERADEIGQAIASGAVVAIRGFTHSEQAEVATAFSNALAGEVSVPYALFAAGAVMRTFDSRVHRTIDSRQQEEEADETDILRSHEDSASRWARILRPAVIRAGGILPSDVVPAFDEDAKLYLAPAPFVAAGGLLAVFDSDSNPQALADLARLWLLPGRHGSGVVLLRTGERVEVPWQAATVLFISSGAALPATLREAVVYQVDVSELRAEALHTFVARRLPDIAAFPEAAVDALVQLLDSAGLASRTPAARATRFLRDRLAYLGAEFNVTPAILEQALRFAGNPPAPQEIRRVA